MKQPRLSRKQGTTPMPLPTDPDRLKKRQLAAQLLAAVTDERLSPQLAINRWPESGHYTDPSLEVAYQALWHFEADEEKQQTELFYLDAQLELLRQMSAFLQEGRDLPAYFLKGYTPNHRVRFFYPLSVWEDSRMMLLKVWREKSRKPLR
jgi:hypothetical protein